MAQHETTESSISLHQRGQLWQSAPVVCESPCYGLTKTLPDAAVVALVVSLVGSVESLPGSQSVRLLSTIALMTMSASCAVGQSVPCSATDSKNALDQADRL